MTEERPAAVGPEGDAGAGTREAQASPRASPKAGPARLGAGDVLSSSQELVLRGWDWSAGRREVAFSLVSESLEGLEAHLALGDIWLARQQEELAKSWASFHAAVEARRLEDLAMQAAPEEAISFAKETREGAIRDAAELLNPLKAERDAAAELLHELRAEREAMEGSLAQKRRELGQLESQLLSAHQAAQAALQEDRKGLAELERQLAL